MVHEPVRGVVPSPAVFSLSGLELVRAYAQRRLPSTPHARLFGYRLTQVSTGSAVVSQPISPWLEIYDGFVDLTTTAELSVVLAAMTAAPPGTYARPVTLSLRYLRPCTVDDTSVIARSRVLHAGSSFTTVETLIEDALGRAVAHATGCAVTIAVDPPPPPLSDALDDVVEDATYSTPDPPRRAAAPGDAGDVPLGAKLLGIEVVEASDQRAVTTMPTTEWFCNIRRDVQEGVVAAQGTFTAALITSRLTPSDERAVTLETTTSFLLPVAPDGSRLRAEMSVHSMADDSFVLDGTVTDARGRRVLVGRGTLLRRPRSRRRAASNRVLLTVLFTDVVGSTQHASTVGDRQWADLLDEHHAVVRHQFDVHMGREVKTTGDGFLATFDSPSRAVQCAKAIRDAVARLGLGIRVGIHTGECEVGGGDVAGLAVHVAARVQAAAQPNEILVSGTVRDLVTGSGLQTSDRGRHALKGLEGEWPLFAVE